MTDISSLARPMSSRGALVADIDLTSARNWVRLTDVDRHPPGLLTCRGLDPQVELLCPDALKRRLTGVLMEVVVRSETQGLLQLLWDLGGGFSPEESQVFPVRDEPITRQVFTVLLPPGVVALRLDPLDRPGRINIHSVRFYELEPAGAAHFPFQALRGGTDTRHSWLDLPEVQQAVSTRLLGQKKSDWPEWLFRGLLGRPINRCLHLGATDAAFGSMAVAAGYVGQYVGVVGRDDGTIGLNLTQSPGVHWAPPELALESGPFDLILSTGFWSRGSSQGLPPGLLARAIDRDGTIVLVERFRRTDPVGEALLTRFVQSCVQTLPPGWFQDPPAEDAQACELDETFLNRFECCDIRPMGGTLVEPLFGRLPAEFFGLGAFTLLGTLAGTYLLLEEALILTGMLASTFNLVVATPGESRREPPARLGLGWAVPAGSSFTDLVARAPREPLAEEVDQAILAARRSSLLVRITEAGGATQMDHGAAADPFLVHQPSWLQLKRERIGFQLRVLQRRVRRRLAPSR